MRIVDYVIIGHFVIQFIFITVYMFWHFNKLDVDTSTIMAPTAVLDVFETIILVMTRFTGFTKWSLIAQAAFYILMIGQHAIYAADRSKPIIGYRLESVFWIAFYLCFFLFDVEHINVLMIAGSKIMNLISSSQINLKQVDTFLKDSWIGGVLTSLLIALVKFISFKIYSHWNARNS